jgi:BMFP domain-containing protein YqiC
MQTDNPVLDGMARFFTNAAGAAQSFRAEIETIVKGRLERLVADLDLVPREEFDAVKAMAAKARAENEKLAARIAALEAGAGKPARSAPRPNPKKQAAKAGRKTGGGK